MNKPIKIQSGDDFDVPELGLSQSPKNSTGTKKTVLI